LKGELEIEFMPMGTICESALMAGKGIPAFYAIAGIGTMYEKGGWPILLDPKNKDKPKIIAKPKETKIFKGKKYIFEPSIKKDYAFIKA